MGFRSSRRTEQSSDTETESKTNRVAQQTTAESISATGGWSRRSTLEEAEAHFGMQIPDKDTMIRLQRLEAMNTTERVRGWVDEGMTIEDMGNPLTIEDFRERQAERPPEVPTNIERQNNRSVQRSEKAAGNTSPAGETAVPDPVRDVISSSGQSLEPSIQRAIEDRMGDSLGDVRIHTGSQAAAACEAINARAFTVGSHIAFNSGEYDPSSAEGQHVLAHELAHVRQQTGGAVSMLPQEDVDLEVDPDPALEQEAKETAQRVVKGGELGIQRLADTEIHVQRVDKTRREVIHGEMSTNEIAAGIEEAELLSVDPRQFRDAYKFAEHAVTQGGTQAPVQLLITKFGLSQPEAMAVTLAVGGTVHVGKDRLNQEDIYLTLEVARLLGVEEQVLAFFERIGGDPATVIDEGDSTGDAQSRR